MIAENQAVIRRLLDEVVVGGNIDAIDELVAPGFVNHNPLPGAAPDREGFKSIFRQLHSALEGLAPVDYELIAEGEKVVTPAGLEGKHKGTFMGVPPTGKQITLDGITVFRVSGGKIVERWAVLDTQGIRRQLGIGG